MTAYDQEKKAIRDANNAKEAALDAITTNDLDSLKAFRPKDFVSNSGSPSYN